MVGRDRTSTPFTPRTLHLAMFALDTITLSAATMASASLWQPCLSSDTLLWGLERSGSNLTSFAADVIYDRYHAFEEERERRRGRLVLEGAGRERKLGCLFSSTQDASGAVRESKDRWVYADGWLGEIDEEHKSFNKRQVVAPGESWDPLKLGEGPFPLPFGQPEAEVRARFEVSSATPPATPMVANELRGDSVCGLRLTPRPESELAKEATSIDVIYSTAVVPGVLVPRVVHIVKPNGDSSTIVLSRPVMNGTLADLDRSLLVMPEPDPKEWSIDIRPWEK